MMEKLLGKYKRLREQNEPNEPPKTTSKITPKIHRHHAFAGGVEARTSLLPQSRRVVFRSGEPATFEDQAMRFTQGQLMRYARKISRIRQLINKFYETRLAEALRKAQEPKSP